MSVRLKGEDLCNFYGPKGLKSRNQAFKQEKDVLALLFRDVVQIFVQSGAKFLWSTANVVKDTSISMQDLKLIRSPSKTVKDGEPQSRSTL